MIEYILLFMKVVTALGCILLGAISLYLGWNTYIRPNHKLLNDLFPNPEPRPLTAGRLLFWIAVSPFIIFAMTLGQ